jgi:hypothetical protein
LLGSSPKKEKVAWNKGLTKETDARLAALGDTLSNVMSGVKRGSYKKR